MLITIATSLTKTHAYTGSGDYKATAQTYQKKYILPDSLRIAEKQNELPEFAVIYETWEKESQLVEQATYLRESRRVQIFAGSIIGLLCFWLRRTIRHLRIVRDKNVVMASTIDDLLGFKDELFLWKEENLMLRKKLQAVEGTPQTVQKETTQATTGITGKENNRNIPNGRALFDRAEREIISRKLFLQPDFSRDELIKMVHIPKNNFSSLFKQYAGMKFCEYINNLRLEHATKLLKEYPEYTIDGIAGSCGISSTTTFYRLFSEKFGMTPTEYRTNKKRL